MRAWSGRLTKANRLAMGLDKTHALDALCIGPLDHAAGDQIVRFPHHVLTAKASGRGSYARTTPDRHGFPRLLRTRAKQHFVSVRARGRHSLTTPTGRINVSHRNPRLLQRGDGYGWAIRSEATQSISRKMG